MSYTAGSIMLASDYMNFRGANAPSVSYVSDQSATAKLAAIIGIGYGTRGYGVTTANLPQVIANSTIVSASQWNDIRSAMLLINQHTGSNLVLQPILTAGSIITAYDGRPTIANIAQLITTLDNNRFNLAFDQSTGSVVLTSTRTTSWSNTVFHEFTVNFGNEDAARYYFNSGGEIVLAASRTGGTSNAINTAVSEMLSDMDNIVFSATDTDNGGNSGTSTNIGYYALTNSYQTVFSNSGSGSYPNISYTVTARRENYTGQNGANGRLLRFRTTVNVSAYSPITVDGTLVSSVSFVKSTGVVTVSDPTFATTFNI